jgi:hypothetical protein
MRKKVAQRVEALGPILSRRRGPSIRNGVLLFKQLILPLMDYAFPLWRSAAHSHIMKQQVLHLGIWVRSKFTIIWEPLLL